MSGAWTPGPWVCDGATFEYEGARFGEAAYVVSKDGEQFPASAANAHLIASAPDMAEALRAIAETEWDMGAAEACLIHCKTLARAALSRAHGGEK